MKKQIAISRPFFGNLVQCPPSRRLAPTRQRHSAHLHAHAGQSVTLPECQGTVALRPCDFPIDSKGCHDVTFDAEPLNPLPPWLDTYVHLQGHASKKQHKELMTTRKPHLRLKQAIILNSNVTQEYSSAMTTIGRRKAVVSMVNGSSQTNIRAPRAIEPQTSRGRVTRMPIQNSTIALPCASAA